MIMKENGFYIIKEIFFVEFNDPYLKGNKSENRPYYYAFQDKNTGLFWVIPMSSKIEKYQNIIDKRKKSNKSCDILHICKLDNGKQSVFLIQDMFPITENYIKREYKIEKNHLKLTSDKEIKIIHKKSKKVLNMIRRNVKFTSTQPDVLKIEKELLKDNNIY